MARHRVLPFHHRGVETALTRTLAAHLLGSQPKMAELAAELGVTERMVQHWVSGERRIPLTRIEALAVLLGLGPTEAMKRHRQVLKVTNLTQKGTTHRDTRT